VDNQFTVHYLQNALLPAHMRHPSLCEQILMVLDIRIFTKVHKNKDWFISVNAENYIHEGNEFFIIQIFALFGFLHFE
jgi:hypothetical protein